MIMITRTSVIDVIGTIWMPAVTAATRYTVSQYDLANMTDDGTPGRPPAITRESVSDWLDRHSGDFQCVDDFRADLETDSGNVTIEWFSEESEYTFNDCMFPEEY